MAGQFFLWSKTAASNATADSTVGWSEGQSPSSVNDSARAMMSSIASWRDDITGTITTGGSSTAMTVTSNQTFDTLARMNGAMVAFVPHATNGATVTLNCDGLGAKPLRSAPSVELPAGVLVQGTPYTATYNNSDAVWYLQNFFVNPYSVPIGGMLDYTGSTAPNSAFVLPYGQAISRTTYSSYFSLVSTTYGTGDGSTTFNLPDLRGRVVAGKDNMGGTGAGRMQTANGGVDGATLGAAGGADTHTLTRAQLPTGITVTGTVTVDSTGVDDITRLNNGSSNLQDANTSTGPGTASRVFPGSAASGFNIQSTGSATLTSNNTSGDAHTIVQPTIVLNKILRII